MEVTRRLVGLGLLWGSLGGLVTTLMISFVAHGPFMGPLVPVFVALAMLAAGFAHYNQGGFMRVSVLLYLGLGFLFGLSHGYVLYAWPLMAAGAVVWQPSPPNPEPA